ncbi:MAG: CDP-alcohol phosphatidyltransferase family protein [Candidatus Poribacteria bacterium]
MAIHDGLTRVRKGVADRLMGQRRFPFSATEVTRLSAWLCLGAAGAYASGHVTWALGAVLAALALDTLDGVVARQNREEAPEVDWAADRFGEAVLVAPIALREAWPVAACYAFAYAANVFLPRFRIPVLPLRHAFAAFCIYVLWLR